MSTDNNRNGIDPALLSDTPEAPPLTTPKARRGDDATRDARVNLEDIDFLSSDEDHTRDATRDGHPEEPCNIDHWKAKGHNGWCVAWHDTAEHRRAVELFLLEEWQVIDAHDLWQEYDYEVVLAAAWEFQKRRPETVRSPSGFFISRLRKLRDRCQQGVSMYGWAEHYM